jgi:DNA-directed RNA polymerase subunit omega
MKLIEGFDSNYRYILVAARRARQLQGGAPPVIETLSRKPCRIAQDEIKAGKVKWVVPEVPASPVEVAGEMLDKAIARRKRRANAGFPLIFLRFPSCIFHG